MLNFIIFKLQKGKLGQIWIFQIFYWPQASSFFLLLIAFLHIFLYFVWGYIGRLFADLFIWIHLILIICLAIIFDRNQFSQFHHGQLGNFGIIEVQLRKLVQVWMLKHGNVLNVTSLEIKFGKTSHVKLRQFRII